ncbi:MAG: topoisomerase DNA-binding C4 zinc finger domain-containing protein [Haloarculaceae archaeon]
MHDGVHVMAGDCTTIFDGDGDREREHRGDLLAVVKPDNTVLVHDAAGYQPVAWLTRAESVAIEDGLLRARDGSQRLRVALHHRHGRARYPVSRAGVPVGDCPDCGGPLVRADGAVTCTGCEREHGLPTGATVTDERCACGLPTVRVERGQAFEVCLDRSCDPLDERVRAAFDREWDCPDCGAPLEIVRRGGLLAGCSRYPDCGTALSLPDGVIVDTCDCGLPVFETATGRRCLDADCEASV